MGQTEVRKAMTYIESKNGLKQLSSAYSEDALHRRFSAMIDELSDELQEYNKLSAELERADEETDWNSSDKAKPLLAQKILAEKASLKQMRETAQKKYDHTVMYENWLNEYGTEFAQLYRIKNNHEKSGFDEELEIKEIDITDNGDILTNDKYNKMNAYAPEPLTELVLHVVMRENEDEKSDEENPEPFGFNFGVMEFNQPNMPPQVKVQLSFDDETLETLNEAKLKRIFAFCDSHGISVSDLQIRRFDGSLAEDLIREKIELMLEKAQYEKENRNKLENKKEKSKEEARHQELENERQLLLNTKKVKTAEELSWDDVSADVVPEHRVMKASMRPVQLAREFVKPNTLPTEKTIVSMAERQANSKTDIVSETVELPNINNLSDAIKIMTTEKIPPVQTIAKGISTPETVPAKEVEREIGEKVKATVQNEAENAVSATPVQREEVAAPQTPKVATPAERNTANEVPPIQAETQPHAAKEAETETLRQAAQQSISVPSNNQTPATPQMPQHSMSEVEKDFEKLLEKGWGKRSGLSYFKTHTGWFKTGWTEYVLYDNEDKDNRKKDGIKQKDGSVKYTYAFKLFLRMEDDGLHFAYRTPNHRKVEPDYINDIAGKLKDLGYTYINFPAGITNAEKGLWRKAMGENIIVPLNMSLNVKHARDMLKAAKETEKYDAKTLAEYGLKLAQEMQRSDEKAHKIPNETRQTFIDGLINTHKYFAFTNAYNLVLKSKIENMLGQQNPQTGSPDKLAAYLTLRKVFEVYKQALENGNSLLNIPEKVRGQNGEIITVLTPEEKRQINNLGLGGNIQKLRPEQMDQLFDLLYARQKREEYDKLKNLLLDNSFSADRGPKIAPNVVFTNELGFARGRAKGLQQELARLGIEDFKPFEDTNLRLEFERFFKVDKPAYDLQNQGQAQGQNQPNQQNNTSAQISRQTPVSMPEKANAPTEQTGSQKKVVVRRVKTDGKETQALDKTSPNPTENKKSKPTQDNISRTEATNSRIAAERQETSPKVDVSQHVISKSKSGNAL